MASRPHPWQCGVTPKPRPAQTSVLPRPCPPHSQHVPVQCPSRQVAHCFKTAHATRQKCGQSPATAKESHVKGPPPSPQAAFPPSSFASLCLEFPFVPEKQPGRPGKEAMPARGSHPPPPRSHSNDPQTGTPEGKACPPRWRCARLGRTPHLQGAGRRMERKGQLMTHPRRKWGGAQPE